MNQKKKQNKNTMVKAVQYANVNAYVTKQHGSK